MQLRAPEQVVFKIDYFVTIDRCFCFCAYPPVAKVDLIMSFQIIFFQNQITEPVH